VPLRHHGVSRFLEHGAGSSSSDLNKLADLIERHSDELAALEALDNGKTFSWAKGLDLTMSIGTIRYYAGWADKIHGQVIETHEGNLSYTRHEPIGVVGQIIPWNFPRM
jgi:aldehyde dehydrogenase (NAD+)